MSVIAAAANREEVEGNAKGEADRKRSKPDETAALN
jgi:hypothetical protein